MHISKIYIENFKSFDNFYLNLNNNLNIIVGDNEAGKSTIIEAIHLALTGLFSGKSLKNELTQDIFNLSAIDTYLKELHSPQSQASTPPHILIEVYLETSNANLSEFLGLWNSENDTQAYGFFYKIEFDEEYRKPYQELVQLGNIKTIPIEYYKVNWRTFAYDPITTRSLPLKSALIDSSKTRFQNGSDIYISRIIKELLEEKEVVEISQAHRKMKEFFMSEDAIQAINKKIGYEADISNKKIELSVELSSKNAWENSLITCFDRIPFHHIGKGEQSMVKTKLALSHKKTKEANVLLLEEPENHLSHTKLNDLVSKIKNNNNKQVIISTHSSFIANKLNLANLILLHQKKSLRLNQLKPDTYSFFEKLSGYDTLRFMLCNKAILVEGDSDELIIQKAFMLLNNGLLPIEKGIDIISVGTSFLRFLEIAEKLNIQVTVVTDNDGNIEAVQKKYSAYLGANKKQNIQICVDMHVDTGEIKDFNYNTLEPKLLKENGLKKLNSIFNKDFKTENELLIHMKANKVTCALNIFDSTESVCFPQYILDSIK